MLAEADELIARVKGHGVFLAAGYGARAWELAPALDVEVRHLYEDAKRCIRAALPPDFASGIFQSCDVLSARRASTPRPTTSW